MSENIQYYQFDSITAQCRRAILAFLIALSITSILFVLFFAYQKIFPTILSNLEDLIPEGSLKNFAQVDLRTFSFFSSILSIWSFLIFKTQIPATLDLFLFSSFDVHTLGPIRRQTGILKWHLPEKGQIPKTWEALENWAKKDAGNGKWNILWLFKRPIREHIFKWTLVTGTNGIGKTQMVQELGRFLAQREKFGDSSQDDKCYLHFWYHDIAWLDLEIEWLDRTSYRLQRFWQDLTSWLDQKSPFSHTPNAVWDAGLIKNSVSDNIKNLEKWRPRAPTLLILDDPGPYQCEQVIDALKNHERYYWWPVRLIIIDQFIPDLGKAKYHIFFDLVENRWSIGNDDNIESFEFFPLVNPVFDLDQLRAVIAGYFWLEPGASVGDALMVETAATENYTRLKNQIVKMMQLLEPNPSLEAYRQQLEQEASKARQQKPLYQEGDIRDAHLRYRSALGRHYFSEAGNPYGLLEKVLENEYNDFFSDRNSINEKISYCEDPTACEILKWHKQIEAADYMAITSNRIALQSECITGEVNNEEAKNQRTLAKKHQEEAEKLRKRWETGQKELNNRDAIATKQQAGQPEKYPKQNSKEPISIQCKDIEAFRLILNKQDKEFKKNLGELFLDELEGNPLLVALAISWLGKDKHRRTFQLSNSNFTSEKGINVQNSVATRLVKDRVAGLSKDCEKIEVDKVSKFNDELKKLLVCATIADGIKYNYADKKIQSALAQSELHYLFPHINGEITTILPIKPWLIGESFILEVWENTFNNDKEKLDELITLAFCDNPNGTLKALKRKGILAKHIADVIQQQNLSDDIEKRLDLLAALTKVALSIHPNMLENALAIIAFLEPSSVPTAYDKFKRLFKNSQHPNSIVAITLFCRYQARLLSEQPETSDFDENIAWLEDLLNRLSPPNDHFPLPPIFLDAWTDYWQKQIAVIACDTDENSLFDKLWKIKQCTRSCTIETFAHVVTAFENQIQSTSAKSVLCHYFAQLFQILQSGWSGKTNECLTQTLAFCSQNLNLSAEKTALLRAVAWVNVAYVRSLILDQHEYCEFAALKVGDIAKDFPGDVAMHREYATAWRCVASARNQMNDQRKDTEAAALMVAKIAKPFPDDAAVQREYAKAWVCVASARSEMNDQRKDTEAAALMVAKIVKPFPGEVAMQRSYAKAWRYVASACSQMNDQHKNTEAAALMVGEIVKPFPGDVVMQREYAIACRHVALSCANIEDQRKNTESAALMVAEIVKPFPGEVVMQRSCAVAWRYVASACSQMDHQHKNTEAAALRIGEIAKPFPGDVFIPHHYAMAWCYVASARSQMNDQRKDTEAAALRVGEIAKDFPGDAAMQEQYAKAWACVAYACCNMDDQRKDTEAAALRVGEIVKPFPGEVAMQREYSKAWCYVAAACSLMNDQHKNTEAAALMVAKIAKPFPCHVNFQVDHGWAWCYAGISWRILGEADKAQNALIQCLLICRRFRDHPKYQNNFTKIENEVKLICTPIEYANVLSGVHKSGFSGQV